MAYLGYDIDIASQLIEVGLDDIHADPSARYIGHLFCGRKTG